MKRAGFTMIELIFVIVILGILAAVAIPRMVGVQDDAKVAAEKGIIGGVRGGIASARGTCMVRNWGDAKTQQDYDTRKVVFSSDCFPIDLEGSGTTAGANGDGASAFFNNVLTEPAKGADGWAEAKANTYTGPATGATGVAGTAKDGKITKGDSWGYDSSSGALSHADS